MYAIVEIQGQQFKAEPAKFLYVHYLGSAAKAGDTVEFDRVLLAQDSDTVKVLRTAVNQKASAWV